MADAASYLKGLGDRNNHAQRSNQPRPDLKELIDRMNNAQNIYEYYLEYDFIIDAVWETIEEAKKSVELIPRFFKYFPSLWDKAFRALVGLSKHDELWIRLKSIQALLIVGSETQFVSEIIAVLSQMMNSEKDEERDAVQKALVSLLKQDVKSSLTALFKQLESTHSEKIFCFIRDVVFPLKSELLKDEMETHVTHLIMKRLYVASGDEFSTFMLFLQSLSLFGDEAPLERVQEFLALVAFSTLSDKEFNQLEFLKKLLETYTPSKVTGESMITLFECLLYTFHQLASKASNATSLCGYGQPSSEQYKKFAERLTEIGDLAKTCIVDLKGHLTRAELRSCNNVRSMTEVQTLHAKSPPFSGDAIINLSWKEAADEPEKKVAKRGMYAVKGLEVFQQWVKQAGPSSEGNKFNQAKWQALSVSLGGEWTPAECMQTMKTFKHKYRRAKLEDTKKWVEADWTAHKAVKKYFGEEPLKRPNEDQQHSGEDPLERSSEEQQQHYEDTHNSAIVELLREIQQFIKDFKEKDDKKLQLLERIAAGVERSPLARGLED